MVEDQLTSVQYAIMVTHNAIILNVYEPIMNGIHNYIMDIHRQLSGTYNTQELPCSIRVAANP